MQIVIDAMTLSNVPEVAAIEAENFSQPWSAKAFEESLEDKDYINIAAGHEGKTVGYITAIKAYDELDIMNVAVDKTYRRAGIGEMLIKVLERKAAESGLSAIFLEVRASNEPAVLLYRKCGFEEIGIRPGFYDKPKEDALLMRKELR